MKQGGEPIVAPCTLTGAAVAPWTPLSAPHNAQYTLARMRDATAHGEWRAT